MKLKRVIIFFLILVLLYLLAIYYPQLTGKSISNQEYQKEKCFVNRIIDGDTIVVSGKEIGNNTHIRLLGINTPEKNQPYSKESTEFLKQIENKEIEILRDKIDEDKYNRKLRYIFYGSRLLNIEILEQGLATSFMTDGLKYQRVLLNAENQAKNFNLGLWKSSDNICADCINLIELNSTADFFILKNNCNIDCNLTKWIIKDDANHFFKIDKIDSNEEKRVDSKNIWNDDHDRLFIRDEKGDLVLSYSY